MSSIFSSINPNTTSGTQLATILDDFKDCVVTGFSTSGGTRPTNLQAGGYWVDTQADPIWDFNVYDGTDDITFMSINTNTNTVNFGDTADSLAIEKISDDSLGAILELFKRRLSGDGQTEAGDTLGQVNFSGYSDSATREVQVRIEAIANEDVTTSVHGSYMRILTTQDGTSSLVERLRIFDDGKIGIGTTSADARLHVRGTSSTGNIKNEVSEDSATGAKIIKKKSRVSGAGQVQLGDAIASDEYVSTDEGSADRVVAETKVVATENTVSTSHGSKYVISIVRDGGTTLTEEVEINNGVVTFNSTTDATDEDTAAVVMKGGLAVKKNIHIGGDLTVEGSTTTVNSTTLEVTDANITINNGGTEASADDVAGITVEMSDSTDAVVLFDKDSPTKFKLGESGSEVNIVDESTAQDVSNKAIKTPSQLDAKQDTYANLITYAATATNGQFCFATDQKVMYQVVDNALTPVGSGGGGLDIWFRQDFSVDTVSNLTVGNSATFKGSDGSLGGDGSLVNNTVTPLNGERSILYTSDSTTPANSLNDYFYSEAIDTSLIQRNFDSGVTLFVRSELDAEVVIWDVTNAQKLNSVLDIIEDTSGNEKRYSASFFIPSNCTQIQYGFHILTTPTGNSQELEFTNIEFSTNPFVYKNLLNTLSVEASGNGGTVITAGTTDIDWTEVRDDAGAWNGTAYEVQRNDSVINITGSVDFTGGNATRSIKIYKNGTSYKSINSFNDSVRFLLSYESQKGEFTAGDLITFRSGVNGGTLNNSSQDHHISINEKYETENVLTPASSNLSNWTDYTPTIVGFGTPSDVNFQYRRVGDALEIQGYFTSGTSTATQAQIPLPIIDGETLNTSSFYNNGVGSSDFLVGWGTRDDNLNLLILADATLPYLHMSFDSSGTSLTPKNGSDCLGSGNRATFFASVKIEGWSADAKFLAAVPTQKVAYLKDVKTSGTDGGTFTSGAWQTRDLNTVEGDSHIVTLSANQFTLGPGEYQFNGSAPNFAGDEHKAKIRNITDGADSIIGSSELNPSAGGTVTNSTIKGRINLSKSTTFEVQHRCVSSTATDGFGVASGLGVDEVYTQLEITKLR